MAAAQMAFLRDLFDAAVAAADPRLLIPRNLPDPPRGRTIVLGAGKASAAMARAFEQAWPGDVSGLVVTPYGHRVACARIDIREASHPTPDSQGLDAARRMMNIAAGAGSDDLVVCLLSGGASSLAPAPIAPILLDDKIRLTRGLLACGASISEINCVRRHVSQIKGGRLAALAHPARVVTLAISDTPGDVPADIGSGPTVADSTTCADALDVLRRYDVAAAASVFEVLRSGAGESIKPGDPRLARAAYRIVGTPRLALEAAAATARARGVEPFILADDVEGEAREVAKVMASLARTVARRGDPFKPPCALLSGGETTVTVHGNGCGGRNVEFLLALALALRGEPGVHAIACDTDGIDGAAALAGAMIGPDTLERGRRLALDARERLRENDGHGFFQSLGDSVRTGPTLTNVNDFRAIYVEAGAPQAEEDAPSR